MPAIDWTADHSLSCPFAEIVSTSNPRRVLVKTGNSFRVVARMLFGFCIAFAGVAMLRQLSAASVTPTFTQTNLVSDLPGMAQITDPNLVNPWGMALGLNSGIWISNNGSGKATTYDGKGQPLPAGSPLVVTIPAHGGGMSSPTGVATNATAGFVISAGGKSAPSSEIFATENGTIGGWNSRVDPTQAVIAVDNSAAGAIYKGLAIGFNESGAFLFATNFHAGKIEVFDSNFRPVRKDGKFRDPHLPAGYAPFGIASINSHLYVTYALQDEDKADDVAGAG